LPNNSMNLPLQSEWILGALAETGLAIIVCDRFEKVNYINWVAEQLTGWIFADAIGKPLFHVLHLVHEATRVEISDLLTPVFDDGKSIKMADHTILIPRHGKELRIDHGAAPIRNSSGEIVGAALLFCDVSERQRVIELIEDDRAFSEGIVQTVHEPLVVLDALLHVTSANRAFYQTFNLEPSLTLNQPLLEIGKNIWDLPGLSEQLHRILPCDGHFTDFQVDQEIDGIGLRNMLLNARRLPPAGHRPELILLAIQDATDRIKSTSTLRLSETRYRRLFETAQDGILLVDPDTRCIFDANPFLTNLLGYSREQLIGKELWEIGLFHDIDSNKEAFRILQEQSYIRYDDLPLKTHDDRGIEVEFVSNVYDVGESRVIQCNIRDVTDRKLAEDKLRVAHTSLEIRVQERTAELASINVVLQNEIIMRELAETDRKRLQQQLTTVQEEERRRIARELHDQMGQQLTGLALGLKVIEQASPNPCPLREELRKLQMLTDQIGRDMHHLALELRPTALDDIGLPAALSNYIEAWSDRSGIESDFHSLEFEGQRLPAAVETALYRIVQEALTNVLRHAEAQRVSVVLQRFDDRVAAIIEDDGKGFDVESVPKYRLGILGMRERAALVDGSLEVEAGIGRGTTVIARIPINNQDNGDQIERAQHLSGG
jgi:PAS domain S-box-containing protein